MSAERTRVRAAWAAALLTAAVTRIASALLQPGPEGYDAWGHVAYVLFLDLYRSVPYADQGWSYFHPPLHYALGWVLAQSGSAQVLVRGLSLWSSAASLFTALLAAGLVRRQWPERPYLPVLAFTALAFLPVHVYTSPMPGNEHTVSLLASAAVAVFLSGTARGRPSLALDLATGALAGLALLTKFSGLLALLAIAAALVGQAARGALPWRRTGARLAAIVGTALLLCAPYYARNLAGFGTPFALSRETPLVASVESGLPPGERHWSDFVRLPPSLLREPDWRGEPLWRSVWGTAYLRTWVEDAPGRALRRALAWAGILPVVLAGFGAARALGRVRRDPGSTTETTLVLWAAGTLAAFVLFAWRVPIFSALKASYLFQLSLPYGFFLALALAEPPARIARAVRVVGPAAIGLAALLAIAAFTPGLARPARGENAQMAAAYAYFGEFDRARAILLREAQLAEAPPAKTLPANRAWAAALRETLAGIEIEAGEGARALALYEAAERPPRPESLHLASPDSPQRLSRMAVAAALAGQRPRARHLLERALAAGPVAEPLVNRAVLRALSGDLAGAEDDLQASLALVPDLPPALANLAGIGEQRGDDPRGALRLRERARQASLAAPRAFPYGVGDGFHLNEPRPMLVLADGALGVYRPARAR